MAAEPYDYTDIVIEMQAQAAAVEASVAQTGVESSQWNMSDTRSVRTVVRKVYSYSNIFHIYFYT